MVNLKSSSNKNKVSDSDSDTSVVEVKVESLGFIKIKNEEESFGSARTKKLVWLTILAYCAPCFGAGGMAFMLTTFTAYFYTDTLGLNAGIVGSVEILLMFMYAFSEPIFGYVSDISSGYIGKVYVGRRKPFLITSSIFHSLTFFCVVSPPSFLSQYTQGLLAWAVVFAIFLGLAWGCNEVAYQALGSQLTFDYDERAKLQACVVGLITTGSTCCGTLHGLLGVLCGNQGNDNRFRFMLLGSLFSGMFLLGNIILVFFVPETPSARLSRSEQNGTQTVTQTGFSDGIIGIFNFVRLVIRNTPFNLLMVSYSLAMTAGGVTPMLLPFFTKHIIQTSLCNDWAPLLFTGCAVVGMPLWVILGGYMKMEKKWRFVLSVLWLCIGLALSAFLATKGDNVLMFIFSCLTGLAFGGYFSVPESMKPDIVDYHEFLTGKRQEAQLAGFWMLSANVTAGMGLQLMLALLHFFGYDGSRPAGDQPPAALLAIRIGYGTTISICALGIIGCILFYPITREKHADIVAATQKRLHGEWTADPLYGGQLLPPYEESVPLFQAPVKSTDDSSPVSFLRQAGRQIGQINTLHGGRIFQQ